MTISKKSITHYNREDIYYFSLEEFVKVQDLFFQIREVQFFKQ